MQFIVSWFNQIIGSMKQESMSYDMALSYFSGIAYDEFVAWARKSNEGDCTVLLDKYSIVRVA